MSKPLDIRTYITIATIIFVAGGNFYYMKKVAADSMPRAEIEVKLELRDKDIEHIKEKLDMIYEILQKE